jgi:transposase-like protein
MAAVATPTSSQKLSLSQKFGLGRFLLWRVDETYVKIHGAWTYLYRAVDRQGRTVDFRLSPNRDVAAAKAFFRKALATQGRAPVSITLDGYAASHRACASFRLKAPAGSESSCGRRST